MWGLLVPQGPGCRGAFLLFLGFVLFAAGEALAAFLLFAGFALFAAGEALSEAAHAGGLSGRWHSFLLWALAHKKRSARARERAPTYPPGNMER